MADIPHKNQSDASTSTSIIVDFTSEFQPAYWRNNRKNLQCFPSCKEHISYDKLVLGHKVHKDSGACHQPVKLRVQTPSQSISSWADTCVVVQFIQLPGAPAPALQRTLSTADLERMERDRQFSCVAYGSDALRCPGGGREFQLRPSGSKSWHLEFKLTTNKRTRKLQRFALQADVYHRKDHRTSTWHLLTEGPSAISTPFSMGCTRTMERKRDSPSSKSSNQQLKPSIKHKKTSRSRAHTQHTTVAVVKSESEAVTPQPTRQSSRLAVKAEKLEAQEEQQHQEEEQEQEQQQARHEQTHEVGQSGTCFSCTNQLKALSAWQPEWLGRMHASCSCCSSSSSGSSSSSSCSSDSDSLQDSDWSEFDEDEPRRAGKRRRISTPEPAAAATKLAIEADQLEFQSPLLDSWAVFDTFAPMGIDSLVRPSQYQYQFDAIAIEPLPADLDLDATQAVVTDAASTDDDGELSENETAVAVAASAVAASAVAESASTKVVRRWPLALAHTMRAQQAA